MSNIPTRVWSIGEVTSERVTGFLRAVYAWMFIGLAFTAAVAAAIASTPGAGAAVHCQVES